MTGMKHTGRAVSMPMGLLTGTLYALAVTLAGTALTAKLVDMEILNPGKIGYAVMVLLMAAAWTGAAVSGRSIQRRILMVSLLSGGCYYLLLLAITALLFGSQYQGAGETALLVLCGSLLPVLVRTNGRTARKGRKIKIRNR